jgi:hypothetical protein
MLREEIREEEAVRGPDMLGVPRPAFEQFRHVFVAFRVDERGIMGDWPELSGRDELMDLFGLRQEQVSRVDGVPDGPGSESSFTGNEISEFVLVLGVAVEAAVPTHEALVLEMVDENDVIDSHDS